MRSHAIRRLDSSLQSLQGIQNLVSLGTDLPEAETLPTGIAALDRLTGGLPRGRITEILGPASSGRTSLLLSTLAQATGREEVCGVVDPAGVFDPDSAARLGADLGRVLWIRTGRRIDPMLKTTDLLLQGGGFGLIGVDFGDLSAAEVRRIPASAWFRLQRTIEQTPTILMLLGETAMSRAAASLVLRLSLEQPVWSSRLLRGLHSSAEILRFKMLSAAGGNRRPGSRDRFELQSSDCLETVSP